MIENLLKLKLLNEEFLRLIRAGRTEEADKVLEEANQIKIYFNEEEINQ